MRILFVEDDQQFREEMTAYLTANGLSVHAFDTFAMLAEELAKFPESLVLLDLTVGAYNGMDFLRDVLRTHGCPCIVLSGHVDETDRIVSLELGADDVILKTTRPREILARIRALIRRSQGAAPRPPEPPRGTWHFQSERRDLRRPDGRAVPLTTAEFNLLDVLVRNQSTPVSREELFAAVFARPFNPLDRAIDNLVAKLRSKLGDTEPSMIRTVRPIGYVFTGFPPSCQDTDAN
jgi:DNA-binding response OmpR family regulator